LAISPLVRNVMEGKSTRLILKGSEKGFVLRRKGKVTWTKDGVAFTPTHKASASGFIIPDFQADNAGFYAGDVIVNKKWAINRCKVVTQLNFVKLDRAVSVVIENAKDLAKPKKSNANIYIKCRLRLQNMQVDNPGSPSNVQWYYNDVLIDEGDRTTVQCNFKRGTYRLALMKTTSANSGTYTCMFNQQGYTKQASVDLTIVDRG